MSTVERSANTEIKGEGKKIIGYAAVFNKPQEVVQTSTGRKMIEVIKPGTFSKSLSEVERGKRSVELRYNHARMLAKTKSKTLTLSEDEYGLRVEATLPDSETVIREHASLGNLDEMSFKLTNAKYKKVDGQMQLIDGDLEDVSIVDAGAYGDKAPFVLRSKEFPDLPEIDANWKKRNELLRKMLPAGIDTPEEKHL